jgi:hypothetical protein
VEGWLSAGGDFVDPSLAGVLAAGGFEPEPAPAPGADAPPVAAPALAGTAHSANARTASARLRVLRVEEVIRRCPAGPPDELNTPESATSRCGAALSPLNGAGRNDLKRVPPP